MEPLLNLETAAEGQELNPFRFSEGEYPTVDAIINHLLSSDEVIEINTEQLSVNGKIIKDGINEYLSTKAVSSSACKEALKSPLHYYHYTHTPIPKKDKSYFDLGTFAHMAFLEPELFEKCVVEPSANLSSHDGCDTLVKFWIAELKKINPAHSLLLNLDFEKYSLNDKKDLIKAAKEATGLQAVTDEHNTIIKVLKYNYANYGGGIIQRLLKGSITEYSFYGVDEETGLPVKIRPDALQVEENIGVNAIISFKTTHAQSIQKFVTDSANHQYELSEGMYAEIVSSVTGRNFNTVITIMLQTVAPFLPAVLFWDADDLMNGKYKYRSAMQTIKDCTEAGKWPGFDAMAEPENMGIINMKQPAWAMRELLPMAVE